MKRSIVQGVMIGMSLLMAIAIPIATFAWFDLSVSSTKDRTIEGEIGLRSYFYTGNGVDKPYEIVTPTHFYNLSRLQNLGVFSGETNFQIGHDFGDGIPKCINDTSRPDDKTAYLDLKSISYGPNALTILPIGNEGTPFVGHFEGNGVPIRNLRITGYPDDIGVFGYVDYKGTVNGLVLDGVIDNGADGVADTADDNVGVEIYSMGYNAHSGDKDNLLFSKNIDDIFDSAIYDFNDAHVDVSQKTYKLWGEESEKRWGWTEFSSMKTANGTTGTSLERLNGNDTYQGIDPSPNHVDSATHNYYNKACFKAVTPAESSSRPFKYAVISSSKILLSEKEAHIDINEDGVYDEYTFFIDMKAFKDSNEGPDSFQDTSSNKEVDTRISIVATTEVDGYKFSRVIQTYVFTFRSNMDTYDGTGRYACNVYLDYSVSPASAGENDYVTNYHHGNNIGFLVGHLNGTLTNSYAYNPKMTFNKSGLNPILTETDTGLVGEIGKNIVNSIDPDMGLTTNGKIGTMNFTKIYNSIRSDAAYTGETVAHTFGIATTYGEPTTYNHNQHKYFSYYKFRNTGPTSKYDLFEPYLRNDGGDLNEPIVKTNKNSNTNPAGNTYEIRSESDLTPEFNKIDFIWNKKIEGENLGLGVFKIITSKHSLPNGYTQLNYSEHKVDRIDECVIANGEAHDKVYFSTAEYDHTYSNSLSWNEIPPLRGLDLPMEYANDINSFNYPFSRDHNYCFELDLNEMDYAGSNYYMSNTKNKFLVNYLSTKIINDHGQPITSGPSFGFMFHRTNETGVERPKSFSSYIKVGKPDFNKKYSPDDSEGEYYPENCIAFSIVNTFGGNVSVIGNANDISIYSVDNTSSSKTSKDKQLYSMRCTNFSNTSDQHRYFKYHVGTSSSDPNYGMVDPLYINNDMDTDSNALYAHIFKLPKGDYVIGARNDNQKANIYYLAVQGQEKGDLDTTSMADMGYKIENVDFLNEQPTYANFVAYHSDIEHSTALKRAYTSFSADFNEQQAQTLYIKTKDYNGNPAMWIDFADGATTFVTYLVTYSENASPLYIQSSEAYRQQSVPYRSPSGN